MPLTQRATRLLLAVGGFMLIPVLAYQVPEQLVLDLKSAPANEKKSLGVPGSSSGSGPSSATALYQLPLLVQITKLSMLHDRTALGFDLELTNTSASAIYIPSCVNAETAHSTGAVDRRTFNFGLVYRTTKQHISQIADVTFGSATTKCLIALQPRASLTVSDEVRLPEEVLSAPADAWRIQAFVDEWKLEDSRYYIEARSQAAESTFVEVPPK